MGMDVIIAEFKRGRILLTENGARIVRDEPERTPDAPTKEKAEEAREALAQALALLTDTRKDAPGKTVTLTENLPAVMEACREWIEVAFAALETE